MCSSSQRVAQALGPCSLRSSSDALMYPGVHAPRPGGDVILRWLLSDRVPPFSASFAEYLFGRRTTWTDGRDVQVPDDFLIRSLTGVASPVPFTRAPNLQRHRDR